MKKLTDAEKKEIIKNILGAADRKKQLGIEADLHCISKGDVKDILKADGVDLRIFCGGRHDKKHIEDELIEEQAQELVAQDIITPVKDIPVLECTEVGSKEWADLAIPPYYTEPNFGPLPESSEKEESAADSPRDIKNVSADDVIFLDTHILEDDKILEAIKAKVAAMAERRRGLVAEIELIDVRLRKYAHFYEDLYDDIQKEGVEI